MNKPNSPNVAALKPEGKSTIKEDVSNTARYEINTQIKNFHDNCK